MRVLITGGAGYLGRITAEIFSRQGYDPILVDNFSTSKKPKDCRFPLYEVDLVDLEATRAAWKKAGPCVGVVHFAARALVPESCEKPELYLRNNLFATLNAAQASVEYDVGCFVHSSSCAVYGIPTKVPIREDHPPSPITPYGNSKFLGERILDDLAKYRGLKVLNLRYFNPSGALDGGKLGEAHDPETHLIPNVVKAVREGKPLFLHGVEYPTPDGSCVRDFIHVEDLAEAHVAAMKFLERAEKGSSQPMNLGTGKGSSVKEIIAAAERVLGKKVPFEIKPPRPGDPPELVADPSRAQKLLGWRTKRSLDDMIGSHFAWMEGSVR